MTFFTLSPSRSISLSPIIRVTTKHQTSSCGFVFDQPNSGRARSNLSCSRTFDVISLTDASAACSDNTKRQHQPYAATSEEDSTGLKRSKCEEPILSSEDMAGDAEAEWKENEDGDTSYVDVSDDELDSSDGIVDDDGCSTLQKRLLCTSDGYDSSPSRKASAMATVMAATVTATATGTATGTAAITQDQVSDSQPERGQHREEEGHFVEGWFDALEEQPLNSTIGSSNIRPGATLELEIERALAAEEEGEMRWRGMAGGNSGRGVEGKTGGLDMDLNTGVDARREMADALKLMGVRFVFAYLGEGKNVLARGLFVCGDDCAW